MKRILIIVPFVIAVILTGCLKDKPNVDFSKDGVVAEITTASTSPTQNEPAAGLDNFKFANLTLPSTSPDPVEVMFTVNIASTNAPTKDIPITLAIDQQALANYISDPNNVQYEVFPDSTYAVQSLTGTVKAGNNNRLDTFYITFYPWKVDPAASYMLPLTITSAPGCTISGNLGTIYFHVVGNPLAGPYDVVGTRYNYSGVIGYNGGAIPAGYVSTAASPSPKTASPTTPTDVVMDYANLGGNGYQYVIHYDPKISTTAITVTANSTLAGAVSNFKVTLQTYDPVTRIIHITSTYNNGAGGSGSDRVIDEVFTHQ
jgi:hypothetical protein